MVLLTALETGRDFTVLGLFKTADPVVQAIMVGLVLCSIACWALIIEKTIRLARLRGEIRDLETRAAAPVASLDGSASLGTALSAAADAETAEGLHVNETPGDLRARVERAMRGAMRTELKRIEVGLPFLATVGSASPFIGLFGTVWGIMHSFTAIAQAKDTSLAVVAPGIAEALFATALGLAAAIPAVIAYNQIAVSLGRAGDRIGAAIHALAKGLTQQSIAQPSTAQPAAAKSGLRAAKLA